MNNDYANDMLEFKKPFLCYDEAFWEVFYDLDNVIVKMFCDITGVNYEKLKNNTFLLRNNEEVSENNPNAKKYEYVLRFCDAHILCLELNEKSITWNIYSQIFNVFNIFDEKKNKILCSPCKKLLQVNLNVHKDRTYPVSKPIEYKGLISHSDYRLFNETTCMYDVCVARCYDEYIKQDSLENIDNSLKWGALLYCEDINEVDKILSILLINENDKKIILERFSKLDKNSIQITEGEEEDIYQKYKTEYLLDNIIFKKKEEENIDSNTIDKKD